MRTRTSIAVTVLLLVLAACGRGGGSDDGRIDVVAAFFPAAELARVVGGPHVRVIDLTPPNAEPHELEPGADDIDRIQDAEVVVFLGRGFQPAVERAVRRADGRRVDLLAKVEGDDPHVWLDPVAMRSLAQPVAEALAAQDPEHADDYTARASDFTARLTALDEDYRTRLRQCDRRVVVSSHAAFGRLAARYGLRHESLTGLTPEAEPDPRRITELADLIRREGVTTVFTEGLEEEKAAQALAREAGARATVLPTLEQPVPGGYLKGMQGILDTLVAALGCRA
jgi:zinc transport system substrate-binding protein